jgi:hypothetical protein
MAVRQYIGARYVPSFFSDENGSTEWKSGIAYEPLTIVTYLGNSYTSKKTVPVGIEITNNEYWVLSGNYNSQIETYREEVEKLKKSLITRNVLCIGDSYLAYNSQEMESSSWGAFLRICLGENNSVTLNGLGGSGFVGNAAKTFGDLLTETYNNMSKEERENISDVIVCGGLNDASAIADAKTTMANVTNAMRRFFTNAISYFPNAKIHVGCIGWMATGFGNRDKYISQLKNIVEVYRKAPNYSTAGKVTYLNGVEYVMAGLPSNYYKADLIHPTASASNELGIAICNALLSGSNAGMYRTYETLTLTPSGKATQITDLTLKATVEKDKMNLIGGVFGLKLNVTDLSALSEIEIATCVQPIRATTTNPLTIEITVAVFPGKTGTYDMVNGELKFANGKVTLKLLYDSSKGHYTGVTNLSVFVPNFTGDILTCC